MALELAAKRMELLHEAHADTQLAARSLGLVLTSRSLGRSAENQGRSPSVRLRSCAFCTATNLLNVIRVSSLGACARRTHQFGLAVAYGIKILPRVPSNFLSFSAREPALLRQLSNRTCWPRGRRRSGGHRAKKKAVHMGVCCRRMRRPVASGESNSRTPRKQLGQPKEPSHRKGLWTNFSNFEPKAGARRRCYPRHSDRSHPPFSPRALHNPATLTGEFHGEAVFSWHV